MRTVAKKMKGKRLLSLLLAMIMAVSVFAPAVSALGTSSYKVELAFNNLFVFDDWADNELSTTVMMRGDGTLEADIEEGSFVFTKTNAEAAEIFTAFSLDTTNAANNANYYTIDVEPYTTYNRIHSVCFLL